MDQNNSPVFFDNVSDRVIDDLRATIRKGSKVNIAAASFSIYAHKTLRTELEKIDELKFYFTSKTFTKDREATEPREFEIPKLGRERSLYGSEYELRLRNELSQSYIGKECADWIRRKKVTFKSKITNEQMNGFMVVDNDDVRAGDIDKLRLAVIDAEKIVEQEFQAFLGNNLSIGDNLRSVSDSMFVRMFSDLNGLWDAHKLRNELIHGDISTDRIKPARLKAALASFRLTLRDLRSDKKITEIDQLVSYSPLNNFDTIDIGEDRGNNAYSTTEKSSGEHAKRFLETFDNVWNDDKRLIDVTDTVLEKIQAAYKENSPEFIYFVALYNIFNEFLEDLDDFGPNEATGFKNSAVWNMLYDFQKDAVRGCISKLEKHNGCILADSVGLGKTFSALGVIKYYESYNRKVLVLAPKRLKDNWNTFRGNYKNNPLAEDRLGYDVLFHTDVNRQSGDSNGISLQNLNWGNYDLVVIDESHNFRNGATSHRKSDDDYENRYQKLMNRIIRDGVRTKVLMLSATPVNNRFTDLKNQMMLAVEGDSAKLDSTLHTSSSVDKIFRDANAAFKAWNELPADDRTTSSLLDMLHFDFFELLDSVTIARSRKHIEKYYSLSGVGKFPARLKPISETPELTDIADESTTFNGIFSLVESLNMEVYTPMRYVQPSKLHKYVDVDSSMGRSWRNRETGRNVLMITNMLKRLESSIYSFRTTSERMYDLIDSITDNIERFHQGRASSVTIRNFNIDDPDADDIDDEWTVGKDLKIDLADIDTERWRAKLEEDKNTLTELLDRIRPIAGEHDLKLQRLYEVIRDKINNPINDGNNKVLIFTAFADTADYLYGELKDRLLDDLGLNSAVVTGTRNPSMTIPTSREAKPEFNTILTLFSPKSKNRDMLFDSSPGEIDILIGTDCISEGQNLQDCDYLINYDIHWNPVRIIQRFGRIDRIGSSNEVIQLTNFWPNISLDEYINLKTRVENRMRMVNMVGGGHDNPIDHADNNELAYRKRQLERAKDDVVDLEEMGGGISIMDLGLNEFHLDLQALRSKYGDADATPHGIHAVTRETDDNPAGVIFVLKNLNHGVNIDRQNRLHPFYLVYISDNGEITVNHLQPKELLNKLRHLSRDKDAADTQIVSRFNVETADGKNMERYTSLLTSAIQSIIAVKESKDIDSIFSLGESTLLNNQITGLDDFELINFLVVKG